MRQFLCVLGLSALACPMAGAATVYSQNGALYTSISASSTFTVVPGYTPDNLFDENPTVNQEVSLGGSDAGSAYGGAAGPGPHYVEFELDSVKPIQSLFYANRDFNNTHNPTFDKVEKIELWASTSTAFAAANPGTAPDVVINIPASPDLRHDSDLFAEYLINTPVFGRYFVISLTGKPTEAGVIGGRELRLGVPEPTSLGLLAGIAVLVTGRRRRAR